MYVFQDEEFKSPEKYVPFFFVKHLKSYTISITMGIYKY